MNDRIRELYRLRDKAEAAYLDLRDAKSNGCCHGFSIPQVLAYDDKILAARDNVMDARIALQRAQDER